SQIRDAGALLQDGPRIRLDAGLIRIRFLGEFRDAGAVADSVLDHAGAERDAGPVRAPAARLGSEALADALLVCGFLLGLAGALALGAGPGLVLPQLGESGGQPVTRGSGTGVVLRRIPRFGIQILGVCHRHSSSVRRYGRLRVMLGARLAGPGRPQQLAQFVGDREEELLGRLSPRRCLGGYENQRLSIAVSRYQFQFPHWGASLHLKITLNNFNEDCLSVYRSHRGCLGTNSQAGTSAPAGPG